MTVMKAKVRPDLAARRMPKLEYRAYFAVIFLFGLPFAVLAWARDYLASAERPTEGPVARAWHEAGAVTPMIFRP